MGHPAGQENVDDAFGDALAGGIGFRVTVCLIPEKLRQGQPESSGYPTYPAARQDL
jgi:hypothetical protein